ncbi:MAG: site-2 protease family protein [Nitrospinae bacterium]|nr:site-2 protease family protein [Nitrospinota bacterium]
MSEIGSIIQLISVLALPMLMAITFHEVAHGFVADKLGDHTARLAGRLTLNPISHLDMVGTLVFIMTRMIGWAKPVPVNPHNLKNPIKDMMWVAMAGPAANLILGAIFAVIYRWIGGMPVPENKFLLMIIDPVGLMIYYSVVINIGLAIFNIIPLPPLDGGRIMTGILPRKQTLQFSEIEPYGFIILLVLIISGAVDKTIVPVIEFVINIFLGRPI